MQGLKLAYISDDTSYLLYAGRWFPVNAYGINRFTATINITVPAHMIVIGSGKETPDSAPPPETAGRRSARPRLTLSSRTSQVFPEPSLPEFFRSTKATKPDWICTSSSSPRTRTLARDLRRNRGQGVYLLRDAVRAAPSTTLSVVEMPDDTVPSAWAPEIAAIASRAVTEKVNYRLLANTIAHQWWGVSVSPASRDDWWLNDGFARYSEAATWKRPPEQAGLEEAVKDMSVGRTGLRHRSTLERRKA